MNPNNKTKFLSLSDIHLYQDPEKWFCFAVVFSPETENNHFDGCPPYIGISSVDGLFEDLYFEVPKIIAYYAKTHPCYTMSGIEMHRKKGEEDFKLKFKQF